MAGEEAIFLWSVKWAYNVSLNYLFLPIEVSKQSLLHRMQELQ